MQSLLDRRAMLAGTIALCTAATGCTTLQEIAALRSVEFALVGASGGRIAGVPIDSVRALEQLGITQMATLTAALARGAMPVEADLLVRASNPPDNAQARLVRLAWTLFLDDQETVTGFTERDVVLPAGQPVDIPVRVQVDLLDFFDRQLTQVVNLGLALAGAGNRQRVRLEAIPTIQTPLGPIRYPQPIPIEYQVGA